jgi:hypothetical protein
MKRSIVPPELFKTGQITPRRFSDGGFATVPMVLSFSFLFISAESLKNHKMKNLILLDST